MVQRDGQMGYSPLSVALLRRSRIRVDEDGDHLQVSAPRLRIGRTVVEWGVAVLVHAVNLVTVGVGAVFTVVVQAVSGAFLSKHDVQRQLASRNHKRHHLQGGILKTSKGDEGLKTMLSPSLTANCFISKMIFLLPNQARTTFV